MVGIGERELRRNRLDEFALGPGCVRHWTEYHRNPCVYRLFREPFDGEHVGSVDRLTECTSGFDPLESVSMVSLVGSASCQVEPNAADVLAILHKHAREQDVRAS